MIKIIVFDLNGVCANNEQDLYIRKLAEKFNWNFDELWNIYKDFIHAAESAEIAGIEVWQKFLEKTGIEGSPEFHIDEMIKERKEDQGVLDLITSLRANYKLLYFTNTNQLFWDKTMQASDTEKYFDGGIKSFEVKARKPAPDGFNFIIKDNNVNADEVIFIDDMQINAEAASELGIHGITFKNKEQLVEELKKLEIKVE